MQIIEVNEGQCLLDIAVQYTGDVENAFALAVQNGLSITDDLEIEQQLNVMDAAVEKRKAVLFLKENKLFPSSTADTSDAPEGIGYWKIEYDFKVS